MKNINQFKWSYYYVKNQFDKKCTNFCLKLENVKNKYADLKIDELKKLGAEYFNFWNELINIYTMFLHNNCILANTTHDVIVYLMCINVFSNNMDLYHLYKGMCFLQKKDYIISKKYFGHKYISIFKNMNKFLMDRLEKEKNYELVCQIH